MIGKLVRKGQWRAPKRMMRWLLMAPSEFEEPGLRGDYAQWLVKNLGRPMERALIRARHRYDKLVPVRQRASALHRAYRGKRRRRW